MRRPKKLLVCLVADTTEGVHSVADYHDGSLEEMLYSVSAMAHMDFTREIHIYLPKPEE